MKNKNAVSRHIEMIISFLLFVGFVMFLLFFIKPYEKATLSESVLAGLEYNLEQQTLVELKSVFIKIENSEEEDCGFKKVKRSEFRGSKSPIIIEDNDPVLKVNEVEDSFYLLVSPGIDNNYDFGNCKDFIVGSIEARNIISNEVLQELNDKYKSKYEDLRESLGVPSTIDFAVSFDGSEMEKNIPEGLNVIARIATKPVLFSNGSIINKEFVFKVW